MMVLLGYFFIAVTAGVAASAIIGFILTNLLISRFQRADRPGQNSIKQVTVVPDRGANCLRSISPRTPTRLRKSRRSAADAIVFRSSSHTECPWLAGLSACE
jgi:hypothetical protein